MDDIILKARLEIVKALLSDPKFTSDLDNISLSDHVINEIKFERIKLKINILMSAILDED